MAATRARPVASSDAYAWNPAHRVGRAGLTLIELLVVIGILAVLMGLLFPVAQRVREAAYQTSCQNNLKQIGVALQAYHNTKGVLPPGYFCESVNAMEADYNRPGWGWAAYILPYLEQSALAAQFQWNQAVEDL